MPYFSYTLTNTPVGDVVFVATEDALVYCGLGNDCMQDPLFIKLKATPTVHHLFLEAVAAGVLAYLNGESGLPDIPLAPVGTEKQQQLWTVMQTIKGGEVVTYKEYAERAGTHARVAATHGCANNPICLFIPCHRVIASNGDLRGYRGGGLKVKQYLLDLEKDCLKAA